MANSIDKPELETLNYRPSKRVNKADNATEQPNCKTCGNTDESCKTIERKYRGGDYPCNKYEPEQPKEK